MSELAKTVLITGCSTGIGRAAAIAFAEAGWNVVGTVRSCAGAADLESERIKLVSMEMTDPGAILAGAEEAVAALGQVDVLVNNAGFGLFGFFEEASEADMVQQVETNLMGPIRLIRAILPHMRARRSGRIINVTSLAAIVGPPLNSYYAATKWGLEGLSEALAAELAPFGISCCIVEPGLTRTAYHGKWDTQDVQSIQDYDTIRQRAMGNITPDCEASGYPAETVAAVILEAATDTSGRMRFAGSPDAGAVRTMRDELGSEGFVQAMRERYPI